MNSDIERRINDIFYEACDLAPGALATYLDQACAGDAELRVQVEALLREAENPENVVEKVLQSQSNRSGEGLGPLSGNEPMGPPSRIGKYQVIGELGKGGMGDVFLAYDLRLKRTVALKLIKLGMDSESVIGRFEQERLVLARLDHLNIAKVFDGGVTAAGRPYFVMEHVGGEPITEYCDKRKLTIPKRLELFIQVCEGVHHAHMRGIIHRDLKPSNILVAATTPEGTLASTGEPGHGAGDTRQAVTELQPVQPLVKVIDFGVAKALAKPMTDTPVVTEVGLRIGTPGYMSPEQQDGKDDVDVRADVYSLGAVLYELLAGLHPPDSARNDRPAGSKGAKSEAFQDAPRRPSERLKALERLQSGTVNGSRESLADLSALRGVESAKFLRVLAEEIELIPMMAMRRDKAERYDSAKELADDLRNALASQPLRAMPPSFAYRTRKLIQRNLWTSIAAAVAVLAVFGSLLSVMWALHNAHVSQALAEYDRYRACIAGAQDAINASNASSAQTSIDLAPEVHRDWEWKYLRATADNSIGHLTPTREPDWRFARCGISSDGLFVATSFQGGPHYPFSVLRLADSKVQEYQIQGGEVASFAFSADGMSLFTASKTHEAQIWDLSKGALPKRIGTWAGTSGDHTLAILTSDSGITRLHDLRVNAPGLPVRLPGGLARVVALSNDGRRCLTFSSGTSAELSALGFSPTRSFPITFNQDGEARFSSDGSRLLTFQSNTHIARIWDVHTGHLAMVLVGNPFMINQAEFSPDGTLVVTASDDRTARIWSTETGQQLQVLSGHEGGVSWVAFDRTGERVATASTDALVRLWNAHDGKCQVVLRGHTKEVQAGEFTSDKSRLVTVDIGGTARVWDVSAPESPMRLTEHTNLINAVAFNPDGQKVVTASTDRTAIVSDMATRRTIATLAGHGGEVWNAMFCPTDERRVVTACEDGFARQFDAVTGKLLFQMLPVEYERAEHRPFLIAAVYSPDGTLIATASEDHTARLWDAATGSLMATITDDDVVKSVAFSPDSQHLLTGCRTGFIKLWDISSLFSQVLPSRAIQAHQKSVLCVSFNRDGTRMLSASEDNTARIWDTKSGIQVQELVGHEDKVMSAFFSPDMKRIVTASSDRTIRLWDTGTGREMAVLRDPYMRSKVNWAVFSPQGDQIAIASAETHRALIFDGVPWRERYEQAPPSRLK